MRENPQPIKMMAASVSTPTARRSLRREASRSVRAAMVSMPTVTSSQKMQEALLQGVAPGLDLVDATASGHQVPYDGRNLLLVNPDYGDDIPLRLDLAVTRQAS